MNRVIVPSTLTNSVLNSLHENHTGVVRMKMIARSYVWWPGIDNDIEEYVKKCVACQQTQKIPSQEQSSRWPKTSYPFERIHIDFFHLSGKTFLLIVDAYSKLCDVKLMGLTNVSAVIEKLQEFFSNFGLPTELVSDNGPPFNSFKFKSFCKSNGIIATNSPPYHPKSNGQVERYVQTVKSVFIKYYLSNEGCKMSIADKINKFLLYSRNTPSTVTSKTPAELIFNYKPKLVIDLLNKKPKLEFDKNNISPKNKKVTFDFSKNKVFDSKVESKFKKGENVLFLNQFKHFVKWIPATVKEIVSKFTYLIMFNNKVRYVHNDQLRHSSLNECYHKSEVYTPKLEKHNTDLDSARSLVQEKVELNLNNNCKRKRSLSNPDCSPEIELRRSKRERRVPRRFTYSE